jgi:hypothetical protein
MDVCTFEHQRYYPTRHIVVAVLVVSEREPNWVKKEATRTSGLGLAIQDQRPPHQLPGHGLGQYGSDRHAN